MLRKAQQQIITILELTKKFLRKKKFGSKRKFYSLLFGELSSNPFNILLGVHKSRLSHLRRTSVVIKFIHNSR